MVGSRGVLVVCALVVARSDNQDEDGSRCFLVADGSVLSFEGAAASVALDVHLEDDGVVDEAVDCGDHHGVVREDPVPVGKWLIGGDQHGAALVACADQLEQHGGFGMILVDVGQVIEDQQVVFVELG